MDNTYVIQKGAHRKQFMEHINSIYLCIKFTTEEARPDACTHFLDKCVIPTPDRTPSTKAYRKPTHTDQYLHCDSQHNLTAKYSVFNTL